MTCLGMRMDKNTPPHLRPNRPSSSSKTWNPSLHSFSAAINNTKQTNASKQTWKNKRVSDYATEPWSMGSYLRFWMVWWCWDSVRWLDVRWLLFHKSIMVMIRGRILSHWMIAKVWKMLLFLLLFHKWIMLLLFGNCEGWSYEVEGGAP